MALRFLGEPSQPDLEEDQPPAQLVALELPRLKAVSQREQPLDFSEAPAANRLRPPRKHLSQGRPARLAPRADRAGGQAGAVARRWTGRRGSASMVSDELL